MRISEISSQDFRQSLHEHHQEETQSSTFSHLETLIKQIESHSPQSTLPENLFRDLQFGLSQLTSTSSSLSNSDKIKIWKLSYHLWNACVDLSNATAAKFTEDHAKFRQFSADLLLLAADVTGVPSSTFKCASFYYKTGLIWHDLRKFDLANNCFEKATDLTSRISTANVTDTEERKILLGLNIARSRTAWEVSDRNLAINLLNRGKTLIFGSSENYKALANQYLVFAKSLLSTKEASNLNDGLKLMNEALELCERGLRIVKRQDETIDLKGLKFKTLRFIAALHLQKDEFDSVLKCVRVLRDDGGDDHPSLSVLAMKAWLGLGRHGEAEKELRGMAAMKEIPEVVWVSVVEAYFQASGAAGAETVKEIFLVLLGKFHVTASSAIRIVRRLAGEGGGGDEGRVRVKVVAEVVSDDRMVALFAGKEVVKERTTMRTVLWNCAVGHFQAKDYEMSVEMFEKSMLYLPCNLEHNILRAKSFRVLCLCYLGLSQLDRAEEYINEAEKLEPNIAGSFLKFKIKLQNNDVDGAIAQMQSMPTYLDFTPGFLSLAAHEALACHTFPVAVASLSNILNLYSSGKSIPHTTEVTVFRTIVIILMQDPGNRYEVLKYMKRAHTRLSELGPELFFGKGEVGNREMKWFGVTSWNTGFKAGKEKNFEVCAQFFRLASEFYGVVVIDKAQEYDIMVCKSLILSVTAVVADAMQKQTNLLEAELRQAFKLLEKAGKILTSLPADCMSANDQSSVVKPNFVFIYTVQMFNIRIQLNGVEPQQLQLVKSFADSKSCNPTNLIQIGFRALDGAHSNHEVAEFALTTGLSSLLASTQPDYQTIALVLRKLIELSSIHHKGRDNDDSDDDVVYGMYKQAHRIMIGLKEGEYPVKEGKWLAMTAWNRGGIPLRVGQVDIAKRWMDIGLDLAKKVHGMDNYLSCMNDFVARLEKHIAAKKGGLGASSSSSV
ncbi:TPR repeat-containing protein ZIP4 [Impatiens glandulifera]|uniref:TPR repeat-containing protein ZIP4 n=1 Tax=Impatiens glandulifera TaxID=253017 RepID=UPI001FB06125|nr:TPR repeat-containing protein ZIP4 [Impatiens glandulifera]